MFIISKDFVTADKETLCFIIFVDVSGSWFRASAITTMNKKPIRCTIVLKPLKLYCILIPL
jgi:hypothetical protein